METIKQKFFNLYFKNWDKLINKIKEHNEEHNNSHEIQHPFLLSTTSEWEKEWNQADIKLMIFGIQTNTWGIDNDVYSSNDYKKSITDLMNIYEEFYFNGGNWEYGNHFWNYFYAIQELLKYHLNKKVSVIWNNVFKIKNAPIDAENTFNVILDEIKIFKPNVIIQMGYDNDAHNQFLSKVSNDKGYKNMDKYSEWDKKYSLYLIKTENLNDNDFFELKESVKVIISTYHPRYSKGIKLKNFIEKTVSELNNI
jgi:hypothetical protein